MPRGFKDTVNSIEKKAFTLKDTLFAIDDYYPSQTLQEGKKMDAVAESRTARALIIEIARGDIDLQLLSQIQSGKDKLSFCMKEYIQYVIDNYDSIKKNCKGKFIEYRNKANQNFAHGRIPEIIASEYMGMELFLEFANNKQAIPHEKTQQLKIESWNDLIKVAQKQRMRTEENRTDNMFFRAVQELLESKKIYLKSYKNHQREPDMSLATFVGYYDEEKQRYYLLSGEKDRNKTRKSINGKLVTFIEVMAVDEIELPF